MCSRELSRISLTVADLDPVGAVDRRAGRHRQVVDRLAVVDRRAFALLRHRLILAFSPDRRRRRRRSRARACRPARPAATAPPPRSTSRAPGMRLRVGLGDRARMAGVGGVVAGDDQGRHAQRLQLLQRAERARAGHLAQGVDDRVEMAMRRHPLAGEAQHRLAPGGVDRPGCGRCSRRSRRRPPARGRRRARPSRRATPPRSRRRRPARSRPAPPAAPGAPARRRPRCGRPSSARPARSGPRRPRSTTTRSRSATSSGYP